MSCDADLFQSSIKTSGCFYRTCSGCGREICIHWRQCPVCMVERIKAAEKRAFPLMKIDFDTGEVTVLDDAVPPNSLAGVTKDAADRADEILTLHNLTDDRYGITKSLRTLITVEIESAERAARADMEQYAKFFRANMKAETERCAKIAESYIAQHTDEECLELKSYSCHVGKRISSAIRDNMVVFDADEIRFKVPGPNIIGPDKEKA